uniref:Uncharacterized protein n=1 Tax=Spongospora subterranea TaxID=70186 RepID=A0A0H5RC94_9EUKA|eukprot:CRZ06124.1 hypothetical protein [Spongospora subterranea]
MTWHMSTAYLSQAFNYLYKCIGDQSMNPYEIWDNDNDIDDEKGRIYRRIQLLFSPTLAITYRWFIGGSDPPACSQFTNPILLSMRSLRYINGSSWDIFSSWVINTVLYQLVRRISANFQVFQSCRSASDSIFHNLLALATVVDEFIFFSPISYDKDSQAAKDRHKSFVRFRSHLRDQNRIIVDYCVENNEQICDTPEDLVPSSLKFTVVSVHDIINDLNGFDYRLNQRKLGIHIDASTGFALDLPLSSALHKLLQKVLDDVLPRLPSEASDSMQSTISCQIRDEVRFFEHCCHFLDNIHIRNEKATLSGILCKRLFNTGRHFKGFTISDKKQWDQYVQVQIEDTLLKEQRRSAVLRKPCNLYIYQLQGNIDLINSGGQQRTDRQEYQLEIENFLSHTHTIGDYQPETSDSKEIRWGAHPVLTRRTATEKNLTIIDEKSKNEDHIITTIHKDRIHPHRDCVCKSIILYKVTSIAHS